MEARKKRNPPGDNRQKGTYMLAASITRDDVHRSTAVEYFEVIVNLWGRTVAYQNKETTLQAAKEPFDEDRGVGEGLIKIKKKKCHARVCGRRISSDDVLDKSCSFIHLVPEK